MHQPRRETRHHTRPLYRDFKVSLISSIVKPMFFISFRIISGHFYVSLARKLLPGLIPSGAMKSALRETLEKHEQSTPPTMSSVRSVRDRFRSTDPFSFLGLSPDVRYRGSVSVVRLRDHRKIGYFSWSFGSNNRWSVGLIIPWSQVRVLAGPPLHNGFHRVMSLRPGDWPSHIIPWSRAPLIEFMELCR